MGNRVRQAGRSAVAAVVVAAGLAGGAAQAHTVGYYPAYQQTPYGHAADPCVREARTRGIGLGILGLIIGGIAGGALAAADVVAEGAVLGGVIGGVTGGVIGRHSAACGTASGPVAGVTHTGLAIYGQPAAPYYQPTYNYQHPYPGAYYAQGNAYAQPDYGYAPQQCCWQQQAYTPNTAPYY